MASLRTSSRWIARHLASRRSLRYSSTDALDEPGKFVSGLTKEKLQENPGIAEFLKSNFGEGAAAQDGVTIPLEVLKEYGYDESDLAAPDGKQYGDPREDKGMGNEEQQALNIRKVATFLREEQGTPACDGLRENFWIPGMLYGSDPTQGIISTDKSTRVMLKTPWAELQRELDRYHRRFESRVYDLTIYEDESDVDGRTVRVLPRDVQRHPVQGKIYCANFLRYHAGRPIKLPIVYINKEESPALKRDGYIIPVNKHVECLVEEGVPIPEALELECSGLKLKDVIRLDRIIFPDGVRASRRVNPETFVVGPVAGGRGGATAADGEGAEDQAA
mmetsp:Transcript_134433/g.389073  ORF Transcript_134433/g.389073 Transcript_134433/m.389073 type:complete len:333 (-) Transcript_134433:30-1028(-)|eukprot:CAMPEP_0176008416 /NCGR_PEP_ID=MMETSP0120_2-20121206/3734_1 /TAXON_ID=160619 /ORGANISM="Kryptoperidinium foliaceum, Strain CCMP 1326" /LENGTH=332 /DNA_ID=CAMNT_0017341201 /DNA_START=55 /DNA_END=1053 /DNA_ORIENTATION=-